MNWDNIIDHWNARPKGTPMVWALAHLVERGSSEHRMLCEITCNMVLRVMDNISKDKLEPRRAFSLVQMWAWCQDIGDELDELALHALDSHDTADQHESLALRAVSHLVEGLKDPKHLWLAVSAAIPHACPSAEYLMDDEMCKIGRANGSRIQHELSNIVRSYFSRDDAMALWKKKQQDILLYRIVEAETQICQGIWQGVTVPLTSRKEN